MPTSRPSPPACQWFSRLASALDPRSAPRLVRLLLGAILARGRRTVTSWIRAAGPGPEYRPCYTTVSAVGSRTDLMAAHLAHAVVKPPVNGAARLTFALDDSPTERSVRANVGAFHPCLWTFTMTEAWAWGRGAEGLVGHRSASPWDGHRRRPNHADKQRAFLGEEIRVVLRPGATERELHAAAERLLDLTA